MSDEEDFLHRLASSLFPDGAPDIPHSTWPERPAGAAVTAQSPEARLHTAQQRFQNLVEQIPAVTFMAVLGEGENEVYVSPHIEQLLGFTQKEWLEDPFLWYLQLHPDDRTLWNEEFTRGCQHGGPFRAECRFLARDGHVVWVHGEARVLRDELGRPSVLQGVAFDITESKRAQEIVLAGAVRAARDAEELAIAQRVQLTILPRAFDVAGLEIAARMLAAADVGGDYYDVLPADDGCWLAIGDVSGHGLDAGLIMLMLQSAMASVIHARPAASPAEVLRAVNEVLVRNIRGRLGRKDHVTLCLLRYRRDGRIRFAGAHEEMLVWRRAARTVDVIPTPGTWLGASEGVGRFLVDTELVLGDGDVLLLYTDGVTEARDASGQMFELERLAAVLRGHAGDPPAEVVAAVVAATRAFMAAQDDDISVIAARYRAG